MSEQITPTYRLAVRVELDDSLDQGTAIVTVVSEPAGEVVVRINRNPLADVLMAFSDQVRGDLFALSAGDPLPEGRPIDPEVVELVEAAGWPETGESDQEVTAT